MAWNEPELSTLKAPEQAKKALNGAFYYAEYGFLHEAGFIEKLTYLAYYLIPSLIFSFMLVILLALVTLSTFLIYALIGLGAILIFFSIKRYHFAGYKNFREYWLNFLEKDEILLAIDREDRGWNVTSIPYEEIQEIKWTGSANGRIIIISQGLSYSTYRLKSNYESSPVHLWSKVSMINAKMTNWPYKLRCIECKTDFYHFTIDAICPIDGKSQLVNLENYL